MQDIDPYIIHAIKHILSSTRNNPDELIVSIVKQHTYYKVVFDGGELSFIYHDEIVNILLEWLRFPKVQPLQHIE